MAGAYYLNDKDREALEGLLDEWATRYFGPSGRFRGTPVDLPSQDFYVARLPSYGLPGLDPQFAPDYGGGAGTGTGTHGDILAADNPGYADCDVYRVSREGTVFNGAGGFPVRGYVLTPVARSVKVFNPFEHGGLPYRWVTVAKSKTGDWMVTSLDRYSGTTVRIDAQPEPGTIIPAHSVVLIWLPYYQQSGTPGWKFTSEYQFANRPTFYAKQPEMYAKDNSSYMYGVTLQDLARNQVGEAVVSGVVACRVDVSDSVHTGAVVQPNSYNFRSSAYNSDTAQILTHEYFDPYTEPHPTTKWAWVRLNNWEQYPPPSLGLLIASDGTSNARFHDGLIDLTGDGSVNYPDFSNFDTFWVTGGYGTRIHGVKSDRKRGARIFFVGGNIYNGAAGERSYGLEFLNMSTNVQSAYRMFSNVNGNSSGTAGTGTDDIGNHLWLRQGEIIMLYQPWGVGRGDLGAWGPGVPLDSAIEHGAGWCMSKLTTSYGDIIANAYGGYDYPGSAPGSLTHTWFLTLAGGELRFITKSLAGAAIKALAAAPTSGGGIGGVTGSYGT